MVLSDTYKEALVSGGAIMNQDFVRQLGLALLIDYYYVSFMTAERRGQDLYLRTSKYLSEHYKNILVGLECEFGIFEDTEDPDNYCWIEFGDEQNKDRVEKYFEAFQFANRKNEFIVVPDLYEGEKSPKQEVCNWYLSAIERFFANNLNGTITIPFGISEANLNERSFMLYTEDGMKGLFNGSMIFKNSPIAFVK